MEFSVVSIFDHYVAARTEGYSHDTAKQDCISLMESYLPDALDEHSDPYVRYVYDRIFSVIDCINDLIAGR